MLINGQEKDFDDISVTTLLDKLGLNAEHVLVECNDKILDKEAFDEIILNKKDTIEIIGFIGGG